MRGFWYSERERGVPLKSTFDRLKEWLWKPKVDPNRPIEPSNGVSVYQTRYMGPGGRIIRSVHVRQVEKS